MLHRVSVLFLYSLLLSACSGLGQHAHTAADNYYQNVKRWQQVDWQDYNLVYQRQCFCVAEVVRKIRVEVRGGNIYSAVYADDNSALNPSLDYDLKSVDDWFKLIVDAIDRPAHSLQVSYDETFGFPNSISIDYYQRMADDEVTVKIFDVIRK